MAGFASSFKKLICLMIRSRVEFSSDIFAETASKTGFLTSAGSCWH